jgi:lantibiotic modifying enzyme
MAEVCRRHIVAHAEPGFDLIGGTTGIGLWALTLAEDTCGSDLVNQALDHLSQTAQVTPDGICWKTPAGRLRNLDRKVPEELEFDLGVAHGIAGVIGFLTRCVELDVQRGRCARMLELSCRWLCSQKLDARSESVFGFVARDRKPARLAWCYGDVGIAMILYRAAAALGCEELRNLSMLAADCAAARPAENSGVLDHSLCHGTAGLVHVFSAIYRSGGSENTRKAWHYWLDVLLKARMPAAPLSGYRYWNGLARTYELRAGLLEGISGIGLVLLSQADAGLGWDWPFLVS